jgi:hypothetical protein
MPKDKKFINDVDTFFLLCRLRDTDFTKKVLSEVERARYCDEQTFYDRFDRGLFVKNLSTTSKILLSVEYYPDMIFNADELGYNGYDLILGIDKGNVLFTNRLAKFCGNTVRNVSVDDYECSDISDVNYAIWGII